jgi:hypothetical protein
MLLRCETQFRINQHLRFQLLYPIDAEAVVLQHPKCGPVARPPTTRTKIERYDLNKDGRSEFLEQGHVFLRDFYLKLQAVRMHSSRHPARSLRSKHPFGQNITLGFV